MPVTTLLVDLDDTVYPPSSGIWGLIGDRIDLFIHDRLQLPAEEIQNLRQRYFAEYGTTLRGLIANYHIDAEDYLKFVHDVPIEELVQPDPDLREALTALLQPKYIFTNSDKRHATRVINALQLQGVFESIIDVHEVAPFCKPQPEAFIHAMELSGETAPGHCLVIDDSLRNLQAAQVLGFRTALVGPTPDHQGVDMKLRSLKDLDLSLLSSL